jgi:hypothetical protein
MCFTSTPRRVSGFVSRVMIGCSSACSSPSVGVSTSTKVGTLSAPHRYTPSSFLALINLQIVQ